MFPHLCLHGHELFLKVLGCRLALVSLRHLSFELGIGGGLVGTPVVALSLKKKEKTEYSPQWFLRPTSVKGIEVVKPNGGH